MKNFEKYKTAEERAHAYDRFCEARFDKVACCAKCELQMTHLKARTASVCPIAWLDLEAEDETLPCPFCGGKCSARGITIAYVSCDHECGYESQAFDRGKFQDAISAHNRVAHAVMEADKK